MARRSTKQRRSMRRRKLAVAAWDLTWTDLNYITLLQITKDLQNHGIIR